MDLKTFPKISTQELNDLLRDLIQETLYITFYARKEKFKPRASRGRGRSYLRVVVPYEEVLKNEDNVPLLLEHLAKNVYRLKWLDHVSLKKEVEDLLGKNIPETDNEAA